MPKYRILTLDGGGIRGILTARLLERLVQQRPHFLAPVELFAGTSTGSFIAVGLAKGLTPTQLIEVYREQGPHIFHRDVFHDLGSLWGFRRARYQAEPRYDALRPVIGDITLDDLLPKHVLIASFQLDWNNEFNPQPKKPPESWKAKFWHNYPGSDSDGPQQAIEVIMRSSAAPTYFPIYQGYVDGGVVANNPSLCALAQALNQQTGGKQAINDVVLVSLGTGTKMTNLSSRNGDWGIEEWGFNLIDLLLESGSGLADYQCRQLLGDCYLRLDPDLKDAVGLDAVDHMDRLLAKADEYPLEPALAWIDRQWES